MSRPPLTALLVQAILEHALDYEWSLPGFGMLRLYLSKAVRLHVWDPTQATKNVSVIHDHPWDFRSEVVCGAITNVLYEEEPLLDGGSCNYLRQAIVCGPGGHALGTPEPVRLNVSMIRTYQPGGEYYEIASALHESRPEPGTVTIVTRTFREDTEHARVCFPLGTEWVSAEPRPATRDEVLHFTKRALERLQEVTLP